VLYCDTI